MQAGRRFEWKTNLEDEEVENGRDTESQRRQTNGQTKSRCSEARRREKTPRF